MKKAANSIDTTNSTMYEEHYGKVDITDTAVVLRNHAVPRMFDGVIAHKQGVKYIKQQTSFESAVAIAELYNSVPDSYAAAE